MPEEIYLDANATTPLLPEVRDAMLPYLGSGFGNASSVHQRGQRARAAVDHAREAVAALIGARTSELVFTSGGTESDNAALFGVLRAGDHLVTTQIEHHAVLHAANELEKRGVSVTFVAPEPSGEVTAESVRGAMQPNTRLVSVMLANNETGVINDVAAISAIAHKAGALLHTDAVQACGKIPVNVSLLGCDLLTLTAHKMHGPQGAGALYVRKKTPITPLLFGGAHERQRRAGTENLAAIVGFGAAAEEAMQFVGSDAAEALAGLRNELQRQLLALPDASLNGTTERVPNTLNVRFRGVDADALIIALDLAGVSASAGSACQSGSTEPSHVLLAMGLTEGEARSSLRLSLSRMTIEEELRRAAAIITRAVERQRGTSL